ncbi:unnamed protein product [Gongylonema pulchrum]|uniref:Transposase n=1 Tax=Gongylonema pulchrum TaxID=637853 RepID=A0A183CUS7_9BILA|nr:unnamed protein product [Gongylonema pulchrum]
MISQRIRPWKHETAKHEEMLELELPNGGGAIRRLDAIGRKVRTGTTATEREKQIAQVCWFVLGICWDEFLEQECVQEVATRTTARVSTNAAALTPLLRPR